MPEEKRKPWLYERWAGLTQADRDAFRAAHYSPDDVEGFSKVMERRIAELSEI